MKLPKKISPDRIKDSFVEIRYNTSLPHEVLIGMIFNSLDTSYMYIKNPHTLANIFYTERISLELRSNSFMFNCIGKYHGWEDSYLSDITKTIEQIITIKEITSFTRIGVRYVSEYPNRDIKEITNLDFTFGISDVKSDRYVFRPEFKSGEYKVILKLENNAPIIKADTEKNTAIISLISIIDVDVILENLNLKGVNELVEALNKTHEKEKEIFFKIITAEFLTSLNPTY